MTQPNLTKKEKATLNKLRIIANSIERVNVYGTAWKNLNTYLESQSDQFLAVLAVSEVKFLSFQAQDILTYQR